MAIVMSGCTRLYKVEGLGCIQTSSYPTDSFQRRQCKYTDFDSIHYKSRWYQSLAPSAQSCVCANDLSFKKCVPWGNQESIHLFRLLLLIPLLCNKASFCVMLALQISSSCFVTCTTHWLANLQRSSLVPRLLRVGRERVNLSLNKQMNK